MACVCLAIGYAVRYALHPAQDTAQAEPSSSSITSKSSRSSLAEREGAHSRQTRENLEHTEGSEQWLHWISAVENAPLDSLPQLARIARGNKVFLQLLAERWFQVDPWHFFRSLEEEAKLFSDAQDEIFPHDKLSELLFKKWVKEDVDSVIKALSSTTTLLNLRLNVFSDVVGVDPRRGVPLMAKWGIRNNGPSTRGVKEWARENPQEAASMIMEHSAGFGTEYCMEAVAKVWAQMDPKAALAFAADAQTNGNEGRILQETVFQEWVSKDMAAASDWLENQEDPDLDDFFRPMIIEAWAKDEPHKALAWCNENLTGIDLTKAIAKLAEGAAAADVQSAANLVGELKPGKQQKQAAVIVAKKWFPDPHRSTAKVSPEAIEWLRTLDNLKVREAVLREVSWSWSTHDMKGFRDFLSEEYNQGLSKRVFRQVIDASVRKDPLETLEWASGLGEDRSLSVSKSTFSSWLQMQPANAAKWFGRLPVDDVRRPAMLNSLVWKAAFSQEAIAVETLRDLPPSDRAQARAIVARSQMAGEKKQGILDLLNQP